MIRTLLLTATFILGIWGNSANASEENTLYLALPTGQVIIKMMPDIAPKHVAQVKILVKSGFYDDLEWFRVIENFIAQTGYPLDSQKGSGGKSTLPDLPDEFSNHDFKRGTVGMGRSDTSNSANSQFFICLNDEQCKHLKGHYTAWGEVTEGMNHIDSLKTGTPPKDPDKTIKAAIGSDI